MKRSLSIAVVATTVLAGCNGGYNLGGPMQVNGPCRPPVSIVLVSPQDNATGVPDNTQAIYIAVSSSETFSAGNSFDLYVNGPPSYGFQYTGNFAQVSYSSIPTPNTVPTYANPVYYKTQLSSTLFAGSSFSVYWNDGGTTCTTGGSVSFIGSFTTQ